MKKIRIVDKKTKKDIEGEFFLANNFFDRLKGLMFRRDMPFSEGLFFTKVSRIHTHFMRFTIDVVYFDKDMKVLEILTIGPWKLDKKVKGAKNVLELNKGTGNRFYIGQEVKIEN